MFKAWKAKKIMSDNGAKPIDLEMADEFGVGIDVSFEVRFGEAVGVARLELGSLVWFDCRKETKGTIFSESEIRNAHKYI